MRHLTHLIMLLALVASSAFMTTSAVAVAAQDDAFGDLGLPEITVNVTNTAFEGLPEETAAGRYLVTVNAAEDMEFGGGISFVQPAGMGAQEFLDALGGPPEPELVDGTPELAEVEGESEGEEMGGPPPFFFESAMAGGVFAMAGTSAHVVLDLTPGEWVAWSDDPEAPQEPVILNVTGEMPADLPEPESSATITMAEFSIEVTEGELTTGPQVVALTNVGAQPHFLLVTRGPDSMTIDDIAAILDADMTGTPAATDLNPDEDFEDEYFTGTQSTDTTIWITLDLSPGKHALLCFFPDIEDGAPHAFHGMYNLVEVSE